MEGLTSVCDDWGTRMAFLFPGSKTKSEIILTTVAVPVGEVLLTTINSERVLAAVPSL